MLLDILNSSSTMYVTYLSNITNKLRLTVTWLREVLGKDAHLLDSYVIQLFDNLTRQAFTEKMGDKREENGKTYFQHTREELIRCDISSGLLDRIDWCARQCYVVMGLLEE